MDPARHRSADARSAAEAPTSFEDVLATAYVPLQRYLLRRTDRTTAEDVLGDVLLVLWRRVDDIPADAVLPWCYAVARRCLANQIRAEGRRERLLRRLADEPAPVAEPADPRLLDALAGLGDTDREVLRLWAWEQLAPREIGTVLGISANAASIRLHRALGRLRVRLGTRKDGGRGGHLLGQVPGGEEASR